MTEREKQCVGLIVEDGKWVAKFLKMMDCHKDTDNNIIFDDYFWGNDFNVALIDGVAKRVENIGEYVKRLSPECRSELNRLEQSMGFDMSTNWKGLAGIRDYIAHDYTNVDYEILSDTAVHEISQLEAVCKQMLEEQNLRANYDED